MNWYKQYKQAMALPEVKNPYPIKGLDFYPQGLLYLDERLTDEHAKKITAPGMEWVGSGAWGSAFAYNEKNVVKKYTGSKFEFQNASEIIEKQQGDQPLPALVYVYDAKDITNDVFEYQKADAGKPNFANRPLYELTIEKVRPLSGLQDDLFSAYYHFVKDMIRNDKTITNTAIINELNRTQLTYNKEYNTFVNAIIKFIRTVFRSDYKDVDIHVGNVGFREEELVILDIGAIEFKG